MEFLALEIHDVLVLLFDDAIETFLNFWLNCVSWSYGVVWENICFFVLGFQRKFHKVVAKVMISLLVKSILWLRHSNFLNTEPFLPKIVLTLIIISCNLCLMAILRSRFIWVIHLNNNPINYRHRFWIKIENTLFWKDLTWHSPFFITSILSNNFIPVFVQNLIVDLVWSEFRRFWRLNCVSSQFHLIIFPLS